MKKIYSSSNEIEIDVDVKRATPNALLVSDGTTEAWIPRSQIKDMCENDNGKITSIFISEWLAKEKGLV